MICVSIGRSRHKHVMAEHAHLVEQGAHLVELRLDYISRSVNLQRLIRDRPCPVIVTCRRMNDGGKWIGSEDVRLMLLRTAIAEGVEYVDLEEDIAGSVPRFGKTKRIVSLHDFTKTPENLEEIHARLASLDPDIVKVSTMANNPHDNLRMLRLIAGSRLPTVGICMGEMGTPSRILAGKFGAPFSYATFHHERTLAPGQLSFRQMTDIYHYDAINADTEVYGVIADPVGHSLSPIIHNSAFHALHLNKVYVPFRVPQADLLRFLDDCRDLGIRGLSVTIPHKEAVVSKCTKVEAAVRGIGAVNTMVFEKDNTVLGFNTDYRAAMECLDCIFGGDADSPPPWQHMTALVLGAGGVAKAIAFGLARRGAKVIIASRTLSRARALAKDIGGQAVDWDGRHIVKAHVLVNGTPIGMHPNVDEIPYEKSRLRPGMLVFDTVYNPEQTLLVKEARLLRCKVITGVEMFIRQAAHQFHHFTQQPAPTDLMRDQLRRAIGPAKY
jgi:3-dehydroquinate dehydratase/shikimate dehydrogenase